MNNNKRILIVRTDRIGDVILTLPLASILKKYFPDSKISFLVREYTKALVTNNKFIDEVYCLVEKNGNPDILTNIKMIKNKFDICIIAYPTFRIATILFFSSIKTRIGTGYRWYSFLFNQKVYEHRKYGNKHELEFNVNLLQHLGINEYPQKNKVEFGIQINEQTQKRVDDKLIQLGLDLSKRIIIIHPGSGGSAIDLPIEKMIHLIKNISYLENLVVLITGNEKEVELCQSLVVNENTINVAELFNLEELIALISKAEIIIANSTGPIHIAAALNKKVIGFYPKFAAVSPKRWGPYTDKAVIFQPTICDGNCNRKKCSEINCMNSIDIEHVTETFSKLLHSEKF